MDENILGLQGKTVAVTGSGQGMGRGIVLAFAKAGANTVIVDLDEAKAHAVADEVRALGADAVAMRSDVRKPGDIDAMVRAAVERFGSLDVGVNNVGGLAGRSPTPSLEADASFWDTVFENNLRTTFLCSQAFAKAMIERETPGAIVNIASISGLRASARLAPYGAAKAGVMHLTQTFAIELAPHGIRVNCVAPASIETPEAMGHVSESRRAAMGQPIPLGRLGQPHEVAAMVMMLASPMAAFVTGQTLMVDGGLSCTSARAQLTQE